MEPESKTLHNEKCECSSSSTNTKERKQELNLCIGGTRVKQTENPKFLGVTHDRQLSFNSLLRDVTKKDTIEADFSTSSRALPGVRQCHPAPHLHRNRKNSNYLRRTSLATWISKTSIEELEQSQIFAARANTGQLKTTPSRKHWTKHSSVPFFLPPLNMR